MKIAYLIETERVDPSRGGTERWSWDYTATLAAAGHAVHVFARAGSIAAPGVTLRVVRSGGVGRARRMLAFAREVERMLAREPFDVVHGVNWTWSQDVFQPHGGVYLANREARGAPTLWSRLSPRMRTCRRIERRQYGDRRPLLFVALSDKVRRDMQRFYDVPPERVRIVYNGVDTERFRPVMGDSSLKALLQDGGGSEPHRPFRDAWRGSDPPRPGSAIAPERETGGTAPNSVALSREDVRRQYGIGDDEVVFLIVAHNFALKGVPELVECVTERDFPACRLVVAGRGDSRRLSARAGTRSPGRVIFAGAVDDAAPLYAAADACVHPTHYDPCSLVVLEALASGLPVVTTQANGASELMQDGREGFVLASAGDFLALREALVRLLDPARRRDMGAAARALALEHTLAHNVREMLDIYDEVLRLKGRA